MNFTDETFANSEEVFLNPEEVFAYCNYNIDEISDRKIFNLDDIELYNYYIFEYKSVDRCIDLGVFINTKKNIYFGFTIIFVKKTMEKNFTLLKTPIKENIDWSSFGSKFIVGNIVIKHINSDNGIKNGIKPNKLDDCNLSYRERLDSLNRFLDNKNSKPSKPVVPAKVLVPEQIVDNVDYKDNVTCKICLNNKINIVCIPCGHCFCSECNTQTRNNLCAVCREPITKTQTLFI